MVHEHNTDDEAERLQRLAGSPGGFAPILRDQIETSLHAGYAWNAKYAKYGIIWVWLFWVLKWGFFVFAAVCLARGLGKLLTVDGYSDWFEWTVRGVGGAIGFGFFALMHAGMAAAQQRDETIAAKYQAASFPDQS